MYAQPFDEFDPRALPNLDARFKTEAEFMAWVEDNNIPPETVARIAAAAQEQRTNARAIAEDSSAVSKLEQDLPELVAWAKREALLLQRALSKLRELREDARCGSA